MSRTVVHDLAPTRADHDGTSRSVPALTTTGTPWEELETHDCSWWWAPEADAIAEALSTIELNDEK